MDMHTPRGIIQGLLNISQDNIDEEETRKQTSTFKQTPSTLLTSTPQKSSARESIPRRSGVKRSAQRSSLLNTAKRSRSLSTPSETITPRATIKTLLKAGDTETPVERTTKLLEESLLQKQRVQPTTSVGNVELLQGSASSQSASSTRRLSRRSSGRHMAFATPRETITPRENIKTFLKAAKAEIPTKTSTSLKETPVKDVISQLQQSKGESSLLSSIVQDKPEDREESTDGSAAEERSTIDEAEISVPSQHEVAHEMSDISERNNSTRNMVKWSKLQTPVLPKETIAKATPIVVGKPPPSSQHQRKSRKVNEMNPKPSQVEKTKKNVNAKKVDARLPLSLVKGIFAHFSVLKVSKDAFDVIESGSDEFFQHLSLDLMSYSKHAKRRTMEQADVELLMRRQGLVSSKESFHALIEKYLPMEYRQEIIPSAKAGNKVVPKIK